MARRIERGDYPTPADSPLFGAADPDAVDTVRQFLSRVGYGYFMRKIAAHRPAIDLFPDFRQLQYTLEKLAGFYRLLFTLLWQGHAADDQVVRTSIEPRVFDALVASGLLVQEGQTWRTPGVAVVYVEGLYLVVAIPPTYPTARWTKQPIYIGPDSQYLVGALPARMRGKRVLDICAGSGVQGLSCLARGAVSVVALERNPATAAVARFNAHLNGFGSEFSVVESDLFERLPHGSMFDLVVSNPPFMPVMETLPYPICGAGGDDGTTLLRQIVAKLPTLLAPRGDAFVIANCLGDQWSITCNRTVLASVATAAGLECECFVSDKLPFEHYVQGLHSTLAVTCPGLSSTEYREHIQQWRDRLTAAGVPTDYVYLQLIHCCATGDSKVDHYPSYPVAMTDPLLRLVNSMSF